MRIASARSSESSILSRLRSPWVGAIQLLAAVSLLLPPGAVSLHADDPPGGPYTYPPASSFGYNYYMTYPEYFDPWVDDCNLINPAYSQGYTLAELLCTNAQGVPLCLVVPDLLDTNADGIPDVMADFLWLDPNDPDAAYAPVSGNEVYTIWEWYHAGQDMRSPRQPLLRWTGDMPNVWKIHWGVDPFDPYFATSDYDNDGLTGWDEYFNYTDPNNGDTDGDSYPDGDEIAGSSDPKDPGSIPVPEGEAEPPASQDSDGDGLDDHWEWEHGLSYQSSNRQTDTDGDGFSDYEEYVFNTDPGSSSSKPTRAMYDTLSAAGDGGNNGAPLPEFFDENVVLEGRWVETSELKRGEFIQNVQWYYPSGEDPYYEPVGPPHSSLVPTQKAWSTSAGESSFWDEQSGGNPEPAPALADLPWEQISSSTDLAAMHGRAYPQEYDGEYYVDSTHSVQFTHHSDLNRVAQIRLARRAGSQSLPAASQDIGKITTLNGHTTDVVTTQIQIAENASIGSNVQLAATTPAMNNDAKVTPAKPMRIVPDDTMYETIDNKRVGKVGDMVPSNKTTAPEFHFVTPKKNDSTLALNEDHLLLRFNTGLSSSEFENEYEWVIPEGKGSADTTDKRTCKINRTTAEKIVVKVQTKVVGSVSAKVVATLNVWVVWAEPAQNYPKIVSHANSRPVDYSVPGSSYQDILAPASDAVVFAFKIEPQAIVEDLASGGDVPALNATRTTAPPGEISALSYGRKWDVSRRVRTKLYNPSPTSLQYSDFRFVPHGEIPATQLPAAAAYGVSFPHEKITGNDDHSSQDEDTNPYDSTSNVLESLVPEHNANPILLPIGLLGSWDAPRNPGIKETAGELNETTEMWMQFEEFVRIQLGENWYVVSGPQKWEYISKYRRHYSSMQDDGSHTNFSHSTGF